MKQSLFITVLTVIIPCLTQAQNQFVNGDLLVGPSHDIVGYNKGIYFHGNSDPFWFNRFNSATNASELRPNLTDDLADEDKFVIGTTNFNDGIWYPHFTVTTTSKIGIKTMTPRAALDIATDISNQQLGTVFGRLSEGNTEGDGTFLGVRGYNTQNNQYEGKSFAIEHSFYGVTNSAINFYRGGNVFGGYVTFSVNQNNEAMRITPNGNIGIGTSSPLERLSVNGKIRAKEVKVEIANWPDYVFEKTYQPISLAETEIYIKTNKHLPEMPSAREAEENGISLGEMNVKLLKKIEELTLYLIEQNKKVTELQNEVKQLKMK